MNFKEFLHTKYDVRQFLKDTFIPIVREWIINVEKEGYKASQVDIDIAHLLRNNQYNTI